MRRINNHILQRSNIELDPPTTFKDFPDVVKLTNNEGRVEELYYVDAFRPEYHACRQGYPDRVSLSPIFRNGSTGELTAIIPFWFSKEEFLFWCQIKGKNPSDLVDSWDMYLRAKRAEAEYAERLNKE